MARAQAPRGKSEPMAGFKQEARPEDEGSEWRENLVAILVVALILLIALGWLFGWFTPKEEAIEPEPLDYRYLMPIDDDPLLGNLSARGTIILFGDHTSPSTKAFFTSTFPELKAAYIDAGLVRFIYRDFPLLETRPYARSVSIAAECADEQGAFWQFQETTIDMDSFTSAWLNATAETIGLDREEFFNCLLDPAIGREVDQDIVAGVNQGGVASVPTLFINGRRLVGNKGFAEFERILAADGILHS